MLCFRSLTVAYLALLHTMGVSAPDSPVLPTLTERPVNGSVKPASYSEILSAKKMVLEKMGLDGKRIGLHAPKVGAVCAMRDAEVDWEDIRVKVGWKKNSVMPERYAQKATKRMVEIDNTLQFYFGL